MSEDSNTTQEPDSKGWTLVYGIHHGNLTSRNTGEEKNLPSLQACPDKLAKREAFYRTIGYVIWFANAISPEGRKEQIHSGNSHYK